MYTMAQKFKERNGLKKRHQIAFRRFLNGTGLGGQVAKYIGTDFFELRRWLQLNFIDGMDWGNYGSVWVVDHLVPLRLFDLTDENELKIAWHYKNLFPLLKQDNLNKQGDLRFSLLLLDGFPQCEVVEALKAKAMEEIATMDKYLVRTLVVV